jgi:hypothetical protein
VSDGKCERGGGEGGEYGLDGVGGEVLKYKKHHCHPVMQWRDVFQSPEFSLLMIAPPLLCQSSSKMHFYEERIKSLYSVILLSASGLKIPLAG